ncbi:MAG: energy-coupling factor transporter ATPase [Coriobacteriaceae bacterium]|nr:energy-coupling factor transporter ATPase [Coriobacteriaceae bacterium]
MGMIITADKLSFSYGARDQLALRNVDLAVREGEIVGIVGPSGSGKTTLLRVLSGAAPHHFSGRFYGSVTVGGRDICDSSLTEIARFVGYVQQDIDAQMVAAIVEDEIAFGLENFGVPCGRIEQRIADALSIVGIENLRTREIAALSGGQKQKVAIAAMLALQPRVLLLDEPTAALDPVSSRAVFEALQRINRELGTTIAVVEQTSSKLATLCDRIAVMNEGRIEFEGTPREVFAREAELTRIGVEVPLSARLSNGLAERRLIRGGNTALCPEEAEALVASLITGEDKRQATDLIPEADELQTATLAPGNNAPRARQQKPAVKQDAPFAQHRAPLCPPAQAEPAPFAAPSAHDTPSVIAVDSISYAYGSSVPVLQNLSLEVLPGEIMGIVGENGAGKTTLVKLLNGLLKPSEGTVTVAGMDTGTTPVSSIAARVATLFQNPDRQLCKNTVLEEVMFGPLLHGVDPQEAKLRAQTIIDTLGLPAEASPFSLSSGQRHLVALAGVLALDPQVIILDEPTSGLDYRERRTVMELVRSQAEAGATVVMICHDMDLAHEFATTIAVMAQGRIVGEGTPQEVFSGPQLVELGRISPPQIMELSGRLSEHVHPAFASARSVAELIKITEELIRHA